MPVGEMNAVDRGKGQAEYPMRPLRIVIADDHPSLREGVKAIFARHRDLSVVGEAATGDEALRLVLAERPDLLLLDIRMPGLPSELVVLEAVQSHPSLKTVVLSAFNDDAIVVRLSQARISGYVLKDEAPEKLVDAVRAALRGGLWFSKAVGPGVRAIPYLPVDPLLKFTLRELAVLRLIGRGLETPEIAFEMSMSTLAVRLHLRTIYAKMDVGTRAEATAWARARGLQ